jgi:glycine oxidase
MPDLKKCVVEHQWAGLRPATISGIPFIGCHQKYENLSFNCGHFRNGLSTGLASAKLLVDLIEKRPPTVDPLPYELNKSNFH